MIKKIAQNTYDLFFLYLNLKNINLLKKINYSRITREKIKNEI